jgi:hypothetical protein
MKVLTPQKEHEVTLPSGHQFEPPRLGRVGEAELFINRQLEFGKQASEPMPDEPEPKAVEKTERAVPKTQAPVAVDPQMLKMLRSLRRAAWFVVWLLALIFIVTLLRR